MALRMMVYVGLLYQDLIKQGVITGKRPAATGFTDSSVQRQCLMDGGNQRGRFDSDSAGSGAAIQTIFELSVDR